MIRAKFQIASITKYFSGAFEQPAVQIELTAICDSSTEENRKFAKYTPSGKITILVDNPPASEALLAGKVFYVDFTPAE